MKRLLLLVTAFAVVATLGLALSDAAIAQTVNSGQGSLDLLGQTGLGGSTPAEAGAQLPIIIGRIIRAVLSLLGIILVVLMIYAGFLWMTARGEAAQVDKAKQTITRAVIGAIIIFMSYAITGFVVNAIINAGK